MNTNSNKEKIIDEFVSALVRDKGLGDVDPEIMEQLKSDLKDRLDDRINAAILAKMPPDQLDNFEKKLNGGNDQEVDQFIASQIPDLPEVISKELLAFRAAYLYP